MKEGLIPFVYRNFVILKLRMYKFELQYCP